MIAKVKYWVKRHIWIKDTLKMLLALVYAPLVFCAYFATLKQKADTKHVWLVGELGVDAKDNGFAFFKYLNKEHPEINSYYYIKSEFPVASDVKKIGQTVETNSFTHMKTIFSADFIFATQDMYPLPWGRMNWREFKILYGWLNPQLKFVFLQHGIMMNDSHENANYRRTRFDKFVTSAKREFEEVSSDAYGYPKGNVINVGLPRFDYLIDNSKRRQKNQILIMPTWRQYLADLSEDKFVNSEYYRTYNGLLTNERLLQMLESNDYQLLFFPPHREIQRYLNTFEVKSSHIHLVNVDEYSIQDTILDSKLMITDYSSVSFDFGILKRPLVYYQFDKQSFRSGHYKEGYFLYEKDGFGPVIENEKDLLNQIEEYFNNDFTIAKVDIEKIDAFYSYIDDHNCYRLYSNVVMGLNKPK